MRNALSPSAVLRNDRGAEFAPLARRTILVLPDPPPGP